MIKAKIVDLIKKAIREKIEIEVFVPENEQFGHYSTNVALKLAKELKKNPMEIAEKLAYDLRLTANDFFEKIEATAPGFINFWLKPEVFQNELKEILKKKENYGWSILQQVQNKKIQIEFISANPTGQLTIGNGRGGFFGDVLANILKSAGYKVVKEYYINDSRASTQIKELGKTALGEGTTYLTKNLESQIAKIKAKLKNLKIKKLKNDLYGEAGHLLAKEVQKDNQKFIKKSLKINFDKWFGEESLYKSGAVEKLLGKLKRENLVYEKDGVLWMKTKDFGDSEDRVLVRASGEPTYFLPDLAYHLNKFKTRKFAQVIDIWGADHHGYEPRLRAGLKALRVFKNGDGKFKVIITQLIRLIKEGKEVKMSKRKGEFITLEDLIKEVGLDAARFFFLMSSSDTHMNFDLSLAKECSMKNPVYYAQYAAVRAQSILQKSKINIRTSDVRKLKLLNTPEDINLMRMLARFSEVIKESAKNYNPQILVRYSLDLARQFHNFYEKERIIPARRSLGEGGGEENNLMLARLELIKATQIIFKNLFGLLGVSMPKKM